MNSKALCLMSSCSTSGSNTRMRLGKLFLLFPDHFAYERQILTVVLFLEADTTQVAYLGAAGKILTPLLVTAPQS